MGADNRALVDDVQDFHIDWNEQRNDNWITARQWEDGMRQVFVNIKNQDGTPFDLTGCNVWFEGFLPKSAKGDFRIIDDEGYVPIDESAGKFRFDMPKQAFPLAGSYRQAFFRILKNGNSVTTLEFDLKVLADKVVTGLVPRDWIPPFERIADELMQSFKDHTAQADKVLNDHIANADKVLNDAMAEVNDPKDGLYIRYSQLLDMTKQIKETLKQAQFHDRPFQFDTVASMKTYAPLMAGDLAITRGWDNYDDGHGAYWNIRVKHKDETPDENNIISLANGMVAERNSSLVSADSLEDLMYGYSIKIVHGQEGYPVPHIFYYEDAIGTEANGLGNGPHGFGQDNTRYIPCEADYPDANTIIVRIPRNFYMQDAPNYKFGAWYINTGNKSIKIDLGSVDDAKAQASDGQGKSYLSAGTGYFSKPTSPSDLRAVYVDEHTQRLLWRN